MRGGGTDRLCAPEAPGPQEAPAEAGVPAAEEKCAGGARASPKCGDLQVYRVNKTLFDAI